MSKLGNVGSDATLRGEMRCFRLVVQLFNPDMLL